MSRRVAAPEQDDCARSPLAIQVLPAREAYDFQFVAARLHDPNLLLDSVAVRIFRAPLLAVPVGGCRRGGRIDAGPVTVALAVRTALLGRPGFPLLRVSLSRAYGESWLVEWGERAPDQPVGAPERLRFFGYSTGFGCPEPPPHAPRTAANGGNDLPLHQLVLVPRDEPVGRGCR
ncbi:DUF6302 family protein [Streptomyces sp. NPDC001508]|uniref:DUF6302 family protein n=1 Tax=Streptomyces sp. NPDC001508 TaxID=3154656 RepID=UPI0033264536